MILSQSARQNSPKIIVIGGGIGGLTTAALLAHKGAQVLVLDQALVPGGCASTFSRKGFIFDVGATQVAGLEKGGIHHRIFTELGIEIPPAIPCDPACAVYLPGESEPINIWRDPQRWRDECQRQFPGSEKFWELLAILFQASWNFQGRDPVLPPRNWWDLSQLIQALRLDTLITVPFTLMTVADALRLCGLGDNFRLKTFLDLQLKLYSQVDTTETALLYAATALSVSQFPQGLYHLQGSMQVLSDRLSASLMGNGGKLLMQHTVESIITKNGKAIGVKILNQKTGQIWEEFADHIVANVTVQNLIKLLDQDENHQDLPSLIYRWRVEKTPIPWGAFVLYLGVKMEAIPDNCPPHLQFFNDYQNPIAENNSLFISVSHPGDGRAPAGMATIIASSFTDTRLWWGDINYQELKENYTKKALDLLGKYFQLTPETIIHKEAATPRTFAKFTARQNGIVGGIGQRISTFGPFGFANRTPIKNLWLVGDSTHPGEGTAGVSYSALTVVRQIEVER